MEGITAIVLNWRRPENVHKIIEGWADNDLIDQAIVWNNNPKIKVEHKWVSVVSTNHDMGLYTRFVAGCLAERECVLIQDDDLQLPLDTLEELYQHWKKNPMIVHGIFGRKVNPDITYDHKNSYGNVPIVLTRVLLTHRLNIPNFFVHLCEFEELQRKSIPFGNGEDIIFSYSVMKQTGKLNKAYKLPVSELPCPHAINRRDWDRHMAHRDKVVRKCVKWLAT